MNGSVHSAYGGMVTAPGDDAEVGDREGDFNSPVDADPVGVWRNRVAEMERFGHHEDAKRMRQAGPPPTVGPTEQRFSPRILAVDVGGDPGGGVAVALSAIKSGRLSLVIVMGHPEAARFTRHLLDLLGRSDVAVVASGAPTTHDLSIVGLTPPHIPFQSRDVLGAVHAIAAAYPYVILWGNCGALTDLAAVYAAQPSLVDRILCTIAAGPLDGPQRFLGPDPTSTMTAINTMRRPPPEVQDPRATGYRPGMPYLITALEEPHTIGPGSALQRQLSAPDAPDWARLLAAHLDQWFAAGHPSSSQYAALTAAELAAVPYLSPRNRSIAADDSGRVHETAQGTAVMLTGPVGRRSFTDWLARFLTDPESTRLGP